MGELFKVFSIVTENAGIVSGILLLVCAGLVFQIKHERKLYGQALTQERDDRREAWKSYNTLLRQTIEAQEHAARAIELLSERLAYLTQRRK